MENTDKFASTADVVQSPLTALTASESVTIPVIEEQLVVGKRVVETGRLRVVKTVREEEQAIDIPLLHEELSVERVAINQYVDTAPVVRQEGDTTVYPVLKEVLVIEKKLVLVEEIHITRRRTEIADTQRVMVRKEEVTVERITPDSGRPA